MLSIITVVYNDKEGVKKTISSVRDQKKYFSNFEYIIVDGGSTDGTVDVIHANCDLITKFISEKDKGIYDAMNKGIQIANGDTLLFLNAGDYFVGNVLGEFLNAPVYLPVKYMNIFGNYEQVKVKNIKKSIPTCHQGIVFENNGTLYDTSYHICADYKYFLTLYKNTKIQSLKANGYIHFDSSGISSTAISRRNDEMYNIRKEFFGGKTAFLYSLNDKVRLLIRKNIQFFKGFTKCSR